MADYSQRHSDITVEAEFSRGPRGLVISRLTVTADAANGVTARALREVPVGAILAEERARRMWEAAAADEGLSEVQVCTHRHAGWAPLTQELLRDVALAFIEETEPGKDKRAMQRLAERFGRPEETVRNWVTRARRDGWLAPGSKGRIGAEAGPRLRAWMAS